MATGHRRIIRTAYSINDHASEFTLESGTPQGDPLSPLLWATVADFALRHARAAGGAGFQIGQRTSCQLLCYADDIALLAAHSHAHLVQTTQAIATALAVVGVRLNAAKQLLRCLPCSRSNPTHHICRPGCGGGTAGTNDDYGPASGRSPIPGGVVLLYRACGRPEWAVGCASAKTGDDGTLLLDKCSSLRPTFA